MGTPFFNLLACFFDLLLVLLASLYVCLTSCAVFLAPLGHVKHATWPARLANAMGVLQLGAAIQSASLRGHLGRLSELSKRPFLGPCSKDCSTCCFKSRLQVCSASVHAVSKACLALPSLSVFTSACTRAPAYMCALCFARCVLLGVSRPPLHSAPRMKELRLCSH